MTVPSLTLNDGTTIPQLGFGVFKVDPNETERIVSDALEVGYRHIDTAAIYGNEEGVGRAIAASGIPRDELYITTKLWNKDQGALRARAAIETSLEKLGLDRVNLYLIHWPCPANGLFLESWKSLQEFQSEGLTTSIGVSNFVVPYLTEVLNEGGAVPVVNQIELHPGYQQAETTALGESKNIKTEAWSPLGAGGVDYSATVIGEIAEAHGVSWAQTILRWHIQRDTIVFPKSNNRGRMQENFDIFGFELDEAQMAAITALDAGQRVGADPAEVS
ncbi:aldo/keto reductase [Humidisolicoccus flavus]|uniref:aldo/keto reductase n=1 Tax=Humidisolicoccus flavus TaxID=3111414 RepID=UPI0032459689